MRPRSDARLFLHRAGRLDGHHAGGHEQHVRLRAIRRAASSRSISSAPTCSSARGCRWTRCSGILSWQARGYRFRRLRRFAEATPIRICRALRSPIASPSGMCRQTRGRRRRHDYVCAARRMPPACLQLTRYDGHSTDLPVVDQVAELRFEYFDAAGQPIATGAFCRRAVGAQRRGCGSLRRGSRRRYAAFARSSACVRPARSWAFRSPTSKFGIDVSPRNLNLP